MQRRGLQCGNDTHVWHRTGLARQSTLDRSDVHGSLVTWHDTSLFEPLVCWVLDIRSDNGFEILDQGCFGSIGVEGSIAVWLGVGPYVKGREAGLELVVHD
jgi:hypothetical protein